MTEAEWVASDTPYDMIKFIRLRASRRKLRLLACACCRRIWNLLPDERSRRAVEMSERYADGLASKQEMSAAQGMATEALRNIEERCRPIESPFGSFKGLSEEDKTALEATWYLASKQKAAAKAAKGVGRATDRTSTITEEMSQAAGWAFIAEMIGTARPIWDKSRHNYIVIIKCIFGNPFDSKTINPSWLTPQVVSLAQAIYFDRLFELMSELGDVLEKTGCDDPEILSHCRSQNPHTRGCWVVDSLLGKG